MKEMIRRLWERSVKCGLGTIERISKEREKRWSSSILKQMLRSRRTSSRSKQERHKYRSNYWRSESRLTSSRSKPPRLLLSKGMTRFDPLVRAWRNNSVRRSPQWWNGANLTSLTQWTTGTTNEKSGALKARGGPLMNPQVSLISN